MITNTIAHAITNRYIENNKNIVKNIVKKHQKISNTIY